jgi:arginyl-tRNA synthetase
VGATLVNIFEHFGIKVNKEYYINDGGNQIEKLALSVFIRYKQQLGENTELPEDSYHGLEIIDVAKLIVNEKGNIYQAAEFSNEKILDDEAREFFKSYSTKYMLDTIKQTLLNYNIEFDI